MTKYHSISIGLCNPLKRYEEKAIFSFPFNTSDYLYLKLSVYPEYEIKCSSLDDSTEENNITFEVYDVKTYARIHKLNREKVHSYTAYQPSRIKRNHI